MEFFALTLIAFALSVDSLVAGASYGVRGIKVPLLSIAIISIMSMLAITFSMLLGYVLVGYFSPLWASKLGGGILILIGLWVLIQSWQSNHNNHGNHNGGENNCQMPTIHPAMDDPGPLVYIRIRSLGLAIQILKEPSKADLDRSGTISSREAVFLGLALALDAFGAGIAVSMLGFNLFFMALLVGLCQFIMLCSGIKIGNSLGSSSLSQKISHLPGFILIALGLFKIY